MATKKKYDPVKIRYKMLANGNRSIYLDYTLADGTRKVEYLKMYLLPGRTADVKRLNEHTLRAVANIKAQRLANLAWNKEVNAGVEQSKRPLFDVIDEYAELRIKRGAKGAKRHYGSVKKRIAGINPNIRLWEVNLEFVTALAESLMKAKNAKGEPLAKATVTGTLSSLGSVLRYAVRKGMISSNPVELYDTKKIKGPVNKRTYLIAEELKRLVDTPCANEDYKRLFIFGCFVGLRFSDLITLRWKDVIEEDGNTRIEKMMSKTKHMVYVPLNKIAMDYLPPRMDNDDLVFEHIPHSVGQIDIVIKEWVKDAGIEKSVTFYTARHTFATLSLTQGADLYSVSQLLGHKDITTTEGYAEIIDVKREEAVYQIDALFSDFLKTRSRSAFKQDFGKDRPAGISEDAKRLLVDVIEKGRTMHHSKGLYFLDYYFTTLRNYVEQFDPQVRLWELDADYFKRFVAFLEDAATDEKVNHLSRFRVEYAIKALDHTLASAKKLGWVKSNVAEDFDYDTLKGWRYSDESLTDNELAPMRESSCEKAHVRQMFLFCCYCDLAMKDVLELKWKDIFENENGNLAVRTFRSKNNHIREQRIPSAMVAILPEHRGKDDYVFDMNPRLPRNLSMDLEQWCIDIGIQRRVTFIDSQHTYYRLHDRKPMNYGRRTKTKQKQKDYGYYDY